MLRVTLRRKRDATVSVEDAASLILSLDEATLLDRSGENLFVEVEASSLPTLREQLQGWIVAPQGERIQIPDTRVRVLYPPE